MNDPLFLFSGDHTEFFFPGVAQNEGEEAEKKKERHIDREVFYRCIPLSRTRKILNCLIHFLRINAGGISPITYRNRDGCRSKTKALHWARLCRVRDDRCRHE